MIDGLDFNKSPQHPSTPSLIYITTYVNNKLMKLLLDTGAQHCFINQTCLKNLHQSLNYPN